MYRIQVFHLLAYNKAKYNDTLKSSEIVLKEYHKIPPLNTGFLKLVIPALHKIYWINL